MACKRGNTLSSDPNYLLSLMSEIGDESDSDEEFDGWLGEDDGPVVTHYGGSEECEASSAQIEHRSRSMHSLVESPLAEQSPTHSPMQLASTGDRQPLPLTSRTKEPPIISYPK